MNKLRIEITALDIRDFVIFTQNKEDGYKEDAYTRITEPGTYEADLFVVSGTTAFRQGKNYRTVFGSGTGWLYSNKAYRFSPSLPDSVRAVIASEGHYTGGGGNSYDPGDYILFNGKLFVTVEAAKKHADWLFGGRRGYGYG